MNYKLSIHPSLSIASSERPSTPEEIESLQSFSPIQIPEEYINLISYATEIEFTSSDCCFRVWGASGCIEMNRAYDVQQYIPYGLGIGDNEAGSILVYLQKESTSGLYLISLSNLDADDALLISSSLDELIYQGNNLSMLI